MPTRTESDELRRQAALLLAQADAIDAEQCTGLAASWCPLHGNCTCRQPENSLDDPDCPLHAPTSTHAARLDTDE